ncbi:hypothetical protein OROHE_006452 [Orobanche hederae]
MEDGFMKRLGKLIDMPMPAKPRERKHSKTTKPKHEKSTMLNFVQQLQQSAFPNHPSSTPPQLRYAPAVDVVKKEEPITNVVGASSRVGGARRKQVRKPPRMIKTNSPATSSQSIGARYRSTILCVCLSMILLYSLGFIFGWIK